MHDMRAEDNLQDLVLYLHHVAQGLTGLRLPGSAPGAMSSAQPCLLLLSYLYFYCFIHFDLLYY